MHKIFVIIFCFAMALSLPACKEKGCTDKNAINYNSVATEDDGSCVICSSNESNIASKSDDLIDDYFSSPHYNQTVARFSVQQKAIDYNNGLCGSRECSFVVSIQSLVNQEMSMQYQLSCSGEIYFNNYKYVVIPANQTVVVDTIPRTSVSNPCGHLANSMLTANAGIINYQ